MLSTLNQFDINLFLTLNGFHSPVWDIIMYHISAKATWIPLYLAVAFFVVKQFKLKKGLLILLSFGILVALADQISVHFFKNVFERLRPCYNVDIQDIIHCPDKAGGHFGFVSSHATNVFAFALYTSLLFKRNWLYFSLFIWAVLVSYSRIYLGVHYPFDVLCGGLLGLLIAFVLYFFIIKIFKKLKNTANIEGF